MIDYVVYYNYYPAGQRSDGVLTAVLTAVVTKPDGWGVSFLSIPMSIHSKETLEIDIASTIVEHCPPGNLLIFSTNELLVKGITGLPEWKKKRWRERDSAPIEHAEAWKALDRALKRRSGTVQWHWIHGLYEQDIQEEAELYASESAKVFANICLIA